MIFCYELQGSSYMPPLKVSICCQADVPPLLILNTNTTHTCSLICEKDLKVLAYCQDSPCVKINVKYLTVQSYNPCEANNVSNIVLMHAWHVMQVVYIYGNCLQLITTRVMWCECPIHVIMRTSCANNQEYTDVHVMHFSSLKWNSKSNKRAIKWITGSYMATFLNYFDYYVIR